MAIPQNLKPYNVYEVAEMLGVHHASVYRAIDAGHTA